MVFAQSVVGVPDEIFTILINGIIIGISASVTTEFLVGSSNYFVTTFKTFLTHLLFLFTKCNHKIQIIRF